MKNSLLQKRPLVQSLHCKHWIWIRSYEEGPKEHFCPVAAISPEYHIYKFRSTKQESSESTDQYAVRLQKLAKFCNFPYKDKEIKSQIIQGGVSSKLRREALQNNTWDLKALLERARTLELTNKQADEIEERDHQVKVNAVSKNKHGQQKTSYQRSCRFCGKQYHQERLTACPARGKMRYFSKVESLRCSLPLKETRRKR